LKRNYLLFCNHIAFCSIGILAALIIGNLNIEHEPFSKWSASLFSYSGTSYSISDEDSQRGGVKNNLLSGFDQLKDKVNFDHNLKHSFFVPYTYSFLSSLNKNIFSKLTYRHFSEFPKYFFSDDIPLYGIRLKINAETTQYLRSDILFTADLKQSKGFISIVKIPDKSFS